MNYLIKIQFESNPQPLDVSLPLPWPCELPDKDTIWKQSTTRNDAAATAVSCELPDKDTIWKQSTT